MINEGTMELSQGEVPLGKMLGMHMLEHRIRNLLSES